ncbi:DUF1543 domain-containing protein [Proteus vulgaris]|nr:MULTISPECIES: DUF1543 domain-containing protein [Proteus]MBQ0215369.1 DUF1543 domain-containing protein [Proteus vulgaris]MDS0788967.1 DUF1543 domain-containing protein [Proteus vulgaris]NBM55044.1 DUF1543 domain-containing protein [Proteus sp. G2669]
MKLFMFYVGGNAGKSNIEVHDIQFVAAEKPIDAWPALRDAWFGDKDKVHIDGYTEITWVDGFDISLSLSNKTSNNNNKLYFVNVGGYHPSSLAELHEFDLFVAQSANEAKEKAITTLLVDSQQQHKDNLKDVDDCILLSKIGDYYIHLIPNNSGEHFKPLWQGYQPIGIEKS